MEAAASLPARPTPPPLLRELLRRRLAGLFGWGAVVLLFAAYPLTLLAPQRSWIHPVEWQYLEFTLILPTVALAALLTLPALLAADSWPRGWWRVPVLVYLAGWGLNALLHPLHLLPSLELLGYVLIPLAVAVLGREGRLPSWPTIGWLGTGLWGVNVVWGLTQWWHNHHVVGITGNVNWLAALLVALTPCALWRMDTWLQAHWTTRWWARVLLALLLLGATLVLLVTCRSRASIFEFWLLLAVLVWWRLRGITCAVVLLWHLFIIPLAAAFLLLALMPAQIERAIRNDVRLPLWGRTGALIVDHDLVARSLVALAHWATTAPPPAQAPTANPAAPPAPAAALLDGDLSGIGAGNFQQVFTPYRALSRYHERKVAAPKTIHPHNEALNIGAQLGVLPMLAWLVLLLPVLWPRPGAGPLVAALATAALLTGGMFDMPLVQAPTNLLAWLCLGLCWIPLLGEPPRWWRAPSIALGRRALLGLTTLAVLVAVATLALNEWRRTSALRAGQIAEVRQDFGAAFRCYLRASELAPDDLETTYRLGLIAWHGLRQPQRALPFFMQIYATDANFIHINELLGTVLSTRHLYAQAVPFFVREVELYPASLDAWQRLASAFVIVSDYRDAVLARQQFDRQLPATMEQYFTPAQLHQLAVDWARAVREDRYEESLALATQMMAPLNAHYVDALFLLAAHSSAWPQTYLRAAPLPDDAAFWHQSQALREWLGPSAEQHPGPALVTALNVLREQVQIDPAATRFSYLARAQHEGRASVWSAYALGCQLGHLAGFRTHVEVDAQGHPLALVCLRPDQVVRCEWNAREPQQFTAAAWQAWQKEHGPQRLRVYYPLHQMLGRNQILAAILQTYAPHEACLPSSSPALLAVQEVVAQDPHAPPFGALSQILITDEFRTAEEKF